VNLLKKFDASEVLPSLAAYRNRDDGAVHVITNDTRISGFETVVDHVQNF
jgi:hypothetical protein